MSFETQMELQDGPLGKIVDTGTAVHDASACQNPANTQLGAPKLCSCNCVNGYSFVVGAFLYTIDSWRIIWSPGKVAAFM